MGVADSAGLDSTVSFWYFQWSRESYRASSNLVRLAVVVLVIRCLSIAIHGHDVWEHRARAVVLVRIDEDAEALKLVGVAKYRPRLRALLGEPHGEAVAVEVALAMDLEFNRDLLA